MSHVSLFTEEKCVYFEYPQPPVKGYSNIQIGIKLASLGIAKNKSEASPHTHKNQLTDAVWLSTEVNQSRKAE